MFRTDTNQHFFLSELLRDTANDIDIRDVTGSYAIFRMLGPNVDETLDKLISPPFSINDLKESMVCLKTNMQRIFFMTL